MASSPNPNPNPSLTYLLVLADTVLEWLRLLDNEEFPVYKSTVADYLSRLENDLWFVHASFQQGGLVVLNSHDHENLLRSSLELVMKMWKKALETRYVFPNKKVVTFMNSVSEPLTVLCHEFEAVTKKLHSSLPNTIINSSGVLDEAKFIVGRENDKAEIMKLINKNNFGMGEKNARVITIFGDSGIGKTTLVRNIYNDMEKKTQPKRFHKCIWVSMGGNYNSGLIEIIRQLLAAGGDVPAYNRDDVPKRRLLEELGRAIDKKKCFIVIDDLIDDVFRNTENYNLLSFLGIHCAWGTRVLVTTRSEKLADELRTSSAQPYRLGPLNGKASWDVFRRRAFLGLNEEELSPELVSKRKAIAEKCEGVPLRLLVISTIILLSQNPNHLNDDDDEVEKIIEELNQLEILLRNEIRHKRYLLILDDVWNEREEKWKSLMALMSYGNGSRIIVTTRSRKVAEITSEKKERLSHELKRLDEDYAWLLFVKVAFEQGEHPSNDEIEKIGRDIVRKCEGIPLLIRTIGSMLFFKNPEEEWQRFYDEKLSEILENASDVLKTLELSYLTLEKSLQLCFAYCGLFPKDYEFEVNTLVYLWASQGYVRQKHYLENLDIKGYDSFEYLLKRFFFQETEKDEFGKVIKCKMQNLMHDLARKVGEEPYAIVCNKEERFNGVIRHVSFDFHLDSSWQIPISLLSKSKMIWSLILPRQFRWAIEGRSNDDSICDVILKFKCLKMLDLHNSGIKVLPDSIGELKNLGYLDLSQNVNIKSLPSCIGELKNLQTLKLNHCSNLRELPSGITKLNGLRNLENESCSLTHMPKGLHKLSKLRRLSEFVLDKGIERSLPELVLDKCIDSLPKKILPESVLNKYCLKEKSIFHPYSLTLSWDIDKIVEEDDCEKGLQDLRPHRSLREFCLSGYGGRNFPKWLSSLKNLVKLSLSKCNKCQFLPPLEHFSKLEVLIVDELMKLQYIVENKSTTTFSSLKEIRLTNLPEVKGWYWNDAAENVEQEEEEEEATFTCLSKLVVEDCPNLTSMPLFPCLEELLLLKNTSLKPFKQTMALAATQEASSSSSSGSSFKQTIVSNKGKEIQQPNELKKPSSTTCSTVAPLSKLRTLHIINMSNGDPNMWQSLHSLRSVTLDHIADINDQLQGLRQVKSLQQLRIWRCDSLEEIPSWINDSNSLKTISIKLCPKLTVSRDKLSLITSSKKVEIEDCPRLSHIATMLKDPLYTQ
ncbi:hypothetical protein G4B88_024936 [Cannabis sativa]|uniref:Uncharacterized protein n=1 Tax=Cannabis sativa TaxID=3483 RepID=A0A7J6G9I1_CANSA|nr:hypothetical protein G4B88_024936 [Cannabis sativa]